MRRNDGRGALARELQRQAEQLAALAVAMRSAMRRLSGADGTVEGCDDRGPVAIVSRPDGQILVRYVRMSWPAAGGPVPIYVVEGMTLGQVARLLVTHYRPHAEDDLR